MPINPQISKYLSGKYNLGLAKDTEEFDPSPADVGNPAPLPPEKSTPKADYGQMYKDTAADNTEIDAARSEQSRAGAVGMFGEGIANALTSVSRARGGAAVDSDYFKRIASSADNGVEQAQANQKNKLSSILAQEGFGDRASERDFKAKAQPLELQSKQNALRNQDQDYNFSESSNPLKLAGMGLENEGKINSNRLGSANANVAEATQGSKITEASANADRAVVDAKNARLDFGNKSNLQSPDSAETMAVRFATETQIDLDAKALENVGDKPAAAKLRANWETFKTRNPNAVQLNIFAKGNGLDTAKINSLAKTGKAVGKETFDMEEKLRDNYTKDPVTKNTGIVRQSYSQVEALANPMNKPTPADDLALVYNFMKSLDPGSTVREGEFAQAAQVGGLPQQVQAYASQVLGNGKLTPQQRAQLLSTAKKAYDRQTEMQSQTDGKHRKLASQYTLDGSRIVTGFDAAPTSAAPVASSGPKPGTVDDGHRFKGGDPSKSENWEVVK